MDDKQKKVLEEIQWHLNLGTRQIWSITMNDADSLLDMKSKIEKIIRESDVQIKLHTENKANNRYTLILESEAPMWAFIFKLKKDDWNYIEFLEGVSDLV